MYAFLNGALLTVGYLANAAALALSARRFFRIPSELFRKILHFILLGIYIPCLFAFRVWWHPVLLALGLIVLIYPILLLCSRLPSFSAFVVERKKGEFVRSMVIALSVLAGSIAIGWGWRGDRFLVLAAVYAWGVGDALAALIGRTYGRHKIPWRITDGKKSYEGSGAMWICSVGVTALILLIRGGMTPPLCLLTALLTGTVCAFTELCAKDGMDTVLCPVAAMAVLLPILALLGG